jgi:dihydrofolate reductase
MRRLILEEWLSLDGFAVDQHGKLDFFPAIEASKFADRDQLTFLDTVDTILLGRKTYELFVDYWPTATTDAEIIADRLNKLPKLVFSNTLQAAPWGKFEPAAIERGDAVEVVRRLKAGPGGNIVMWGSLSLARVLMDADLIDEYHIQVCPVVVGGGRATICARRTVHTLRTNERSHVRQWRCLPELRTSAGSRLTQRQSSGVNSAEDMRAAMTRAAPS